MSIEDRVEQKAKDMWEKSRLRFPDRPAWCDVKSKRHVSLRREAYKLARYYLTNSRGIELDKRRQENKR